MDNRFLRLFSSEHRQPPRSIQILRLPRTPVRHWLGWSRGNKVQRSNACFSRCQLARHTCPFPGYHAHFARVNFGKSTTYSYFQLLQCVHINHWFRKSNVEDWKRTQTHGSQIAYREPNYWWYHTDTILFQASDQTCHWRIGSFFFVGMGKTPAKHKDRNMFPLTVSKTVLWNPIFIVNHRDFDYLNSHNISII